MKHLRLLLWISIFFSFHSFASPETERLNAEALLLYHDAKFSDALKKVELALESETADPSLLELKALCLKALHKNDAAIATYEALIADDSLPEKKKAGYHFEVGLLNFQKKEYEKAELSLRTALRQKFNTDFSSYLLAKCYLEKKEFTRAEAFLKAALRTEISELKAQVQMALAQLYAERENYRSAWREIVAARELASSFVESSDSSRTILGRQILESTQPLFDKMERQTIVGQVGISSAYDSNVLLNPTSNADSASTKSSLKQTISYALLYAGSQFAKNQWNATLQGSANYNFNQATKAGQFAINDLTVTYSQSPAASLRYGAKMGAQYILRTGADGTASSGSFASYSATATIGPFLKKDLSSTQSLHVQVLFQPQWFLQDSESASNYRKTGWGGLARAGLSTKSFLGLENSDIALVADLRQTDGSEFRAKALGIDWTASRALSSSLLLSPGASISYTAYQFREEGYRGDWFFSGNLTSFWQLSPELSVNLGVQVAKNFSNVVETYEYFRFVTSGGLNYIF